MDLEPSSLIASFIVSGAGWVFFSYGRKMKRGPQVILGLVLMVYPYFISNVLLMLGIAALLIGGFWYALRAQIIY
jgi:hypothetical protein